MLSQNPAHRGHFIFWYNMLHQTATILALRSIKELTLTLYSFRPFHFMARRPSLLPLALPPHPANSTRVPLSLSGIRSTVRGSLLSSLESTLAKVYENKGL